MAATSAWHMFCMYAWGFWGKPCLDFDSVSVILAAYNYYPRRSCKCGMISSDFKKNTVTVTVAVDTSWNDVLQLEADPRVKKKRNRPKIDPKDLNSFSLLRKQWEGASKIFKIDLLSSFYSSLFSTHFDYSFSKLLINLSVDFLVASTRKK